jgi:hypothetical protein
MTSRIFLECGSKSYRSVGIDNSEEEGSEGQVGVARIRKGSLDSSHF